MQFSGEKKYPGDREGVDVRLFNREGGEFTRVVIFNKGCQKWNLLFHTVNVEKALEIVEGRPA